MYNRKIAIGPGVGEAFSRLNSFGINWFLTGKSCLEFACTHSLTPYRNMVDIGIYDSADTIDHCLKNLSLKNVIYFDKKLCEATLFSGVQINMFIFIDFHGYVVETRHRGFINRYRLLCYDPKIITDGTEKSNFVHGNVSVLKNKDKYCKTLFGENYRSVAKQWDTWSDPANVIWEDFIQRPIRLT